MPADDARSGASSPASTVAAPAPAASPKQKEGPGAMNEKSGGRDTKEVNGKRMLTGRDAETRKVLGMAFPTWKKWWIISGEASQTCTVSAPHRRSPHRQSSSWCS